MTGQRSISRHARAIGAMAVLALAVAAFPAQAQSPAPAKGFEPVPVEGAPGFQPVTPAGAGVSRTAEAPAGQNAVAGHDKGSWQRTAKAENR